jgi:putative Mg2+ transporter-C (MgtC) family protein
MSFGNTELRALGYVMLAMLLGGIIGVERELEDKPAGLRTHMLVAGASALLVMLGEIALQDFIASFGGTAVNTDPVRVLQALVTGVAFLGAGTIIRHKAEPQIEGLTTASSLLFTAAVGACVAFSYIVLAIGATVLVLITLRGLTIVERWLENRRASEKNQKRNS